MLNALLQQHLKDTEQNSWIPEDITTYEICFPRNGQWFRSIFREQSDQWPRGMTRERAKGIAGKTGRVYKTVIHRERIQ